MKLEQLWNKKLFPDADAIVYASGKMTVMSSEQIAFDDAPPCVLIAPIADTSIGSFFTYNAVEDLAPLTILFEFASDGLWLKCGESADGRAGWFAVGEDEQAPDWIAYFRSSNPFVGGSIDAGSFTVKNNHGEAFSAPVSSPEQLSTRG